MCGYIGSISSDNINKELLFESNKLQTCRGPDELKILNGEFKQFTNCPNKNFSLIFNRLSIQELSELGSQPMYSEEFNSMLLFNGEIFNHNELRDQLIIDGVKINSASSDTEVVIKSLSKYGTKIIEKFNGQFSIIFFDFNKKKIFLIRDRLGQKPLFYHLLKNNLSFSTNLKSLVKFLGTKKINNESINEFLSFGVVSSPNTIFENIYKLEPGQIIEINLSHEEIRLDKNFYWKPEDFVAENKFNKNVFNELLVNAVTLRNIADVPVGNLLSGGIDSTTIIKIMHDNKLKINSFSVTYDDEKYDESKWSDQVVNNYGIKNLTTHITLENIKNDLFESLKIFDEPYFDPSNLPSYKIYKEISKNYKVALSGDGGDELMGGYTRTQLSLKRNSKPFSFNTIYKFYPSILGTGAILKSFDNNLVNSYKSFISDEKFNLMISGKTFEKENYFKLDSKNLNSSKLIMLLDYKFYLPEMMHLKIDRTSMANSLEIRSPFVDHKLVEYMLSVDLKNPDLINKEYLKNFLKPDFDEKFLYRKKMGFVFNLEKFVFKNEAELKIKLFENNFIEIKKNTINKLFRYRSRINAQRIWKLITLVIYFEEIEEILN